MIQKIKSYMNLRVGEKERLEAALHKARREERESNSKHFMEREARIKAAHLTDLRTLAAEKDAEIRMLESDLNTYKRKSQDAENVYGACWSMLKNLMSVSSELKMKSRKLYMDSSESYQEIERITDIIDGHHRVLVKQDKNFRKKLGYDPRA